MTLYAVIMLAAALLILAIAMAIGKGNAGLIHDYHQQNISEDRKEDYCREFAVGLYVLCGSMLVSSLIDVFFTESIGIGYAIAVFTMGLIMSLTMILRTQKKYNGGLF